MAEVALITGMVQAAPALADIADKEVKKWGLNFSESGWKGKSRKLLLSFINSSNSQVKVSDWIMVSGKQHQGVSSAPFLPGNSRAGMYCEGDGTWMTGVSGTFKISCGSSYTYVFVSNPYAGCCKVHFADTAADADNYANDGNPKDCRVGKVTWWVLRFRICM